MEGQTEREPRYALSDCQRNRRRFRASQWPATATHPLTYPSRVRVPMTRMRVPMTQMRVPMTRIRVQEVHCLIDLRDALGSRRDGMLATGPAHSLPASCLSSPQLRLDTDRPAVGAVGALTARRARCNVAVNAVPAGRQPHPRCACRAPLRLPACPLHCPPACSTACMPNPMPEGLTALESMPCAPAGTPRLPAALPAAPPHTQHFLPVHSSFHLPVAHSSCPPAGT